MAGTIQWFKDGRRRLGTELAALYLACRDPRVPGYAKTFTVCVVAYALSPLDLIPDCIPVLGYLDDLVLVPFGIWLALKLIPRPVLEACRQKARAMPVGYGVIRNLGTTVIVALWVFLTGGLLVFTLWPVR